MIEKPLHFPEYRVDTAGELGGFIKIVKPVKLCLML